MAFLFDNKATVAYAVIVTVWSALFLPAWDVAEYYFQYEWDTFDLVDGGSGGINLDEPRPDFKRQVRTTRINPITGLVEQYMPARERCAKIASSFSIVAMMVRRSASRLCPFTSMEVIVALYNSTYSSLWHRSVSC